MSMVRRLIPLIVFLLVCASVSVAEAKRKAVVNSKNRISTRIIERGDWEGRPYRQDISKYEDYGLKVPSPNKIVLHNSNEGHGIGKAAIQAVQNFHMDNNGWSDVGYNFLIDSGGNIYEGRSLSFVPSHAGRTVEADKNKDISADPDYGSIGVVLLGEAAKPFTAEQEEAAKKLIKLLQSKYPSIGKLLTHSEVKDDIIQQGFTPIGAYDDHICPGKGTRQNIIDIRKDFPHLVSKRSTVGPGHVHETEK